VSSPALEQLYAKRLFQLAGNADPEKPTLKTAEELKTSDDKLLLRMSDAKKLATMLDAPELALEAERAIVQVEEKLKQQKNPTQESNDTSHSKKDS
jgi:hypothetical protein